MPCSKTQHGLTRVGLEPPTSGSGIRGINHQATAPSDFYELFAKMGNAFKKSFVSTFEHAHFSSLYQVKISINILRQFEKFKYTMP